MKGWRERAADIFAKHGEIAAKMKSDLGPGTTIILGVRRTRRRTVLGAFRRRGGTPHLLSCKADLLCKVCITLARPNAAQFGAEAVGLGFVVVHDGILKRCAAEATLRRGDSPTANPKL